MDIFSLILAEQNINTQLHRKNQRKHNKTKLIEIKEKDQNQFINLTLLSLAQYRYSFLPFNHLKDLMQYLRRIYWEINNRE